jgi:hypothetical protein
MGQQSYLADVHDDDDDDDDDDDVYSLRQFFFYLRHRNTPLINLLRQFISSPIIYL